MTPKDKDIYTQKMEAQLKEWRAQIDLLTAKIENASADAKIKWTQQLEEVRAMHDTASQRMRELKETSDDAWEETKMTAEKAWETLKIGLADAASKFK